MTLKKLTTKLFPFLLPLLFISCAQKVISISPNPPPSATVEVYPDTDKMLRMFSPFGFAHACPTIENNQTVVWTARHVAIRTLPDMTTVSLAFIWSDNLGNNGYAKGGAYSEAKDLSTLTIKTSNFEAYPKGATPQIGDQLYWLEYVLDDYKDFMRSNVRNATVIRIVAGHIVFDQGPVEGASGSCVLNEAGEAVGVVIWGFYVEYNKETGVGVLF